jgi:hypothetical protein
MNQDSDTGNPLLKHTDSHTKVFFFVLQISPSSPAFLLSMLHQTTIQGDWMHRLARLFFAHFENPMLP